MPSGSTASPSSSSRGRPGALAREFFRVDDNIRRPGLLLGDSATDAAGLKAVIAGCANSALAEVEHSGLKGRGGAGFTTALKWRFCREAEGTERYVVCNADEDEPGTFKDRLLLTGYADLVFEGMSMCARVIGARKRFLYLRGEYLYLLKHLETVLARRREQGLSGAIASSGRLGLHSTSRSISGQVPISAGEESALIESLEGKRAVTRKRPPFPVTSGFLGRPPDQPVLATAVQPTQIFAYL